MTLSTSLRLLESILAGDSQGIYAKGPEPRYRGGTGARMQAQPDLPEWVPSHLLRSKSTEGRARSIPELFGCGRDRRRA